ncbi:hypothetical protein CBS63078_10387 [Aspergillus niger]|uniref:HCNGP-domain-containing protein n=3 Tax=Aspergillus TaxID=5052 RepID=A0A370P3S3_ASPPH|nr:hypothetical protein CBS133816_10381 [Aspergillus niger]RDK36512.1 hypothetical protein M752DRAFT_287771 [Aspergillus phoenicis ATCC 13157]KAI2837927.1 hypothetical protein CBS11350_8462 [Aspergillus niger]KAI2848957.1 hypothetical protein CBS12448_9005 [Aspergillus niger]KAI2872806.1 hypothetical protein CBS13152_9932 [Aspergillus niger]
MLGLGAYESSSDEEVGNNLPSVPSKKIASQQAQPQEVTKATEIPNEATPSKEIPAPDTDRPVLGPTHEGSQDPQQQPAENSQVFLADRALIHDLTLPPLPNLDIPPSPPGSPNPAANAKIAHFLTLKKQGMHFNEKLAGSTSLKNPSLLKKMMDHAGIDDQAQYHTSLPPEVWSINDLPSWGYKEELLKAQREIQIGAEERKSAGQRDAINFVAATPSESSRTGPISSSRAKQR